MYCGLILNPLWPFLGAYPNGTVCCAPCCGSGVVEIKRPYCSRFEEVSSIERVLPDEVFWIDCVKKSEAFFTSCIFPELLGKWYSKPLVPVSAATTPPPSIQQRDSNSGSSDPLYCYCRQPEDITRNDWIGCDNTNCVIE